MPSTSTRTRQRRDPEQMRRLISRRESEGLSYAALSRQTGIPIGTLANWSRRVHQEGAIALVEPRRSGFVEVIGGSAPPVETVDVQLPGGIELRIPSGLGREAILRIMTALMSC